ncbi:Serine/threonine-protein kinase PknK [Starkeya nomas]|uniref:Serine/threonine-protein kinase PknK n=2 Tax=Starkeya nomas TaxID=2666134 RepID=A0A5S9Q504_9HYPH|nr:Serine/threonine-protein kinase PknK [Starkeya nomas]
MGLERGFLATKFLAPRMLDKLVERPGLLAQLESALERKLTLVHAPAGFGKTTFALSCRHIMEKSGICVAWLNIDRLDADPARFLRYVVEAVRKVEPDLIRDQEIAFEQSGPSLIQKMSVEFINGLAAADREICVAIEDLHLIGEDAASLEILSFLIERSSANVRFLVTSRLRPKLPLSRLRVARNLTLINARDLRLDEEEARSFLQNVWELDVTSEAATRLWRSTDGWLAALQLAALSLRGEAGAAHRLQSTMTIDMVDDVGEYLAENVFDTLPQDTLNFLLKTSILQRLSSDLCDAVCGRSGSQAMLEELVRQNLFIRPADDHGEWFRYHHLFADHLQRRLHRDCPSWIRDVHLAACGWLDQAGDTEAAVTHAKAAGDLERAITIVDKQAMNLAIAGRYGTLIGLVNLLPKEGIRKRLSLLQALSWAYCLTRRMEKVNDALRDMRAILDENPDSPEATKLRGEAQLIQSIYNAYLDRVQDLKSHLYPLIAEPWKYNIHTVASASNMISFAMFIEGDLDGAVDILDRNFEFHDRDPSPVAKLCGLCYLGLAERSRGRMDACRVALEKAYQLALTDVGSRSFGSRIALGVLGLVVYESGDVDRAVQLINENRKLDIEGGVIDFSMAAYVAALRIAALRGRITDALNIVEEGLQTATSFSNERLRATMIAEKVRLYLARGLIDGAKAILADYSPAACDDRIGRWITQIIEPAQARVLAAGGQTGEALAMLEHHLDLCRQSRQRLLEFRIQLQIATTLGMAGEPSAALSVLTDVVAFAAQQGLVQDIIDEGPVMRTLLERLAKQLRASDDNAEVHRYVWDTLRRWPSTHPTADPGATADLSTTKERGAGWGEQFNNRELQILDILARGKSNKEIARALGLDVNTIKWHLKNIYSKLGVNSRIHAVVKAGASGLLPSDD